MKRQRFYGAYDLKPMPFLGLGDDVNCSDQRIQQGGEVDTATGSQFFNRRAAPHAIQAHIGAPKTSTSIALCKLKKEFFMTIKTLLLPDFKTSIALAHIARVATYKNGVGILNMREKMIGWIPCEDEEVAMDIVYALSEVINNPGRAKHPEWEKLLKLEKAS